MNSRRVESYRKEKRTHCPSCSNMVEHFMMSFLWTGPMLTPEYCWEKTHVEQVKLSSITKEVFICSLTKTTQFQATVKRNIGIDRLLTPCKTNMLRRTFRIIYPCVSLQIAMQLKITVIILQVIWKKFCFPWMLKLSVVRCTGQLLKLLTGIFEVRRNSSKASSEPRVEACTYTPRSDSLMDWRVSVSMFDTSSCWKTKYHNDSKTKNILKIYIWELQCEEAKAFLAYVRFYLLSPHTFWCDILLRITCTSKVATANKFL